MNTTATTTVQEILNQIKFAIIGNPEYKLHFSGDTQKRYVFKCKIARGRKSFTVDFGQSINRGAEEPSLDEIMECLQKYDVGSFEDFCSDFGYDEDSRTAERIYKAVCKEFENMSRLFSEDELQILSNID